MPSPDPTRVTLVAALAALATLNALLWAAGLRLAGHLFAVNIPSSVLTAIALFSGLVVLLFGAIHLREPVPTRA